MAPLTLPSPPDGGRGFSVFSVSPNGGEGWGEGALPGAILGCVTPPEPVFRTFADFWPFYLGEHSRPATRALHFAGTTLGLSLLVAGIVVGRPRLFLAALVAAYGLAWIGHFFVERNRPATFQHPWWSLAGDFKMYGLMWRGRLADELARIGRAETP